MKRKQRYIVLAVMTALTAFCLSMFPRININDDMTRYLPDNSRMKHGIDSLKKYFPETDLNAHQVKAMFSGIEDKDSLANVLSGIKGVDGIVSVEEKDSLVLFQLTTGTVDDTKSVAGAIKEIYVDSVVVEHNADSIMPENMGLILIIGLSMVFGILFLMCSSIVEALLFILTIGMAVVLNMGTNAFLPSISMMTNTIVAVLQFVLSMDYSIILMNRFRQIHGEGKDIDESMGLALKSASPSILSSGFTTIVGLLALLFMKFKIGMDLGIVLAKGVLFSLISIYTILPALILIFYNGIIKTRKKVFLIPTDRLARFELEARIPLAIIFVAIFGLSWYLSGKTDLSYASVWESRINEKFTPKNSFSILYRTELEDKLPDFSEINVADSNVIMSLSYPALFKKEMTSDAMCENVRKLMSVMSGLSGDEVPFDPDLLTPEMTRVLYYAASHPERDEKMSFEDMIRLAEDAAASGYLPKGLDVGSLFDSFLAPDTVSPAKDAETPARDIEASVNVVSENQQVREHPQDTIQKQEYEQYNAIRQFDTEDDEQQLILTGNSEASLSEIAKTDTCKSGEDPYELKRKYNFTKEELHTPMNSVQLAEYLGFSKSQASAAFTLAKKKNGTMTPV